MSRVLRFDPGRRSDPGVDSKFMPAGDVPGRRSPALRGVVVACTAIALLAGCHTFAPAPLDSVRPGDQVRVRLAPGGRDRLERELFVEVRVLEGEVEWLEDGNLVLDVPWAVRETGFHSEQLTQQVDLEREEYFEVEQKVMDGLRTGLALAGGGAVAGVVLGRIIAGDTGGNTGQPGGGPAETVIVRLPVPFR